MAVTADGHIATLSADQARTLLMLGNGLLEDPRRRAGPMAVGRAIEQMGFVQLDSINVVERAHHLILHSRLRGYRRRHLSQLVEKDRALFEHWTHDASMIPTQHFPHWKGRFSRFRPGAWFRTKMGADGERICSAIRDRMEREGALRSRDLHESGSTRNGQWWGWSPTKAALELMWRRGEILISRRERFEKVYDLAHRVLPDHHHVEAPHREETIQWACESALERLGAGTASEVARFWNDVNIVQTRRWLDAAVKRGVIERVTIEAVDGSKPKPAYAMPGWRERVKKAKKAPRGMRLLSPFDPVIRDRDRLKRLFGFDYRFEAFVPESKRKFGYYVLPVLDGDRLVARINPKLHRDRELLEVKGVWWEKGCQNRACERGLKCAVEDLAEFVGARDVEWARKR